MPTYIAYFLTSSGRKLFAALEPGLARWRPRVQGTFLLAHALMVARGGEGTRYFGRKIDRYVDLYGGGGWRARLPVWPLILTVVPNETRASELRHATEVIVQARAEGRRIIRAFRFTSLDALRGDAGPFAEIWQVAGRTGRFPLIDEPATAADVPAEHRAQTSA
jgi:hypothetical protein